MLITDGVHIVSTESIEELHELCEQLGLKRHWYQGYDRRHPHYDVPILLRGTIEKQLTTVPSRLILQYSHEMWLKAESRMFEEAPVRVKPVKR